MIVELEKSLSEIKDGIKGVVEGQGKAEAKFVDLEKTSKEMHEFIKTVDGRVMALETYLKDRKAGVGVSLPGLEVEKQKFSFAKAMVCAYFQSQGQPGIWEQVKAGFEKEVMTQATQKAMDTGTAGGGGGYIVPQEVLQDIIDMLRAEAVVIRAGATVLSGLTGSPIKIPKQTQGGSVYWVGENEEVTKSDAKFGEIAMFPKTMAMRTQFSNLLNLLSNPSIEQLIRQDFAITAALELDRVALRGSGSANEPLGLKNIPGMPTYAIHTDGGDYTRSHALKQAGVVEDANALRGRLAYITNPKVRRVLMNERILQFSGDTAGAYVILPMSPEELAKTLGYPMLATTQIPANLTKGSSSDCSEVVFGNWADLMIGMWGALEILATNVGGTAWAQNAIEVRLIQNVDVQCRRKESFAYNADSRTNNA